MQGCASSNQGHCGLLVKQHHTTNDLGGCLKWLDPVHVALLYESKHKRHIAKDHSQHFRAFRMTSDSQNSSPTMTLQRSNVMTAGERRSHRKITVASLCCDVDEANSAFTASTKGHQSYGLKASSTSHAAPTQAKRHQLECPGLPVTLPLPLSAHSHYPNVFQLATQDSPPSCPDTTKMLSGARHVTDLASGSVPHPNRAFDHDTDLRLHPATQTAHVGSPKRILRPARPSYTDDQRFFIMYYRIVREYSWPQIEVEFARLFNLRTKDALTSVYYRTRTMWGMKKILGTDLRTTNERSKVESEASRFSEDFLMGLGYFDQAHVSDL
jgi:hypothetical protein